MLTLKDWLILALVLVILSAIHFFFNPARADELRCVDGVCITVLDPPVEQTIIPASEDK